VRLGYSLFSNTTLEAEMKCFRVLFLFAVGFFASAPAITTASAQVVVSGNYYEEFKSSSCTLIVNPCFLVFSATPQNVFITDVSCQIISSGPGAVYSTVLGVSDSDTGNATPRRQEYFIPVSVIANVWSVRSKAGFLFGAGRWPEVIVTASGAVNSMSFSCKISGTFVVP
jgi:hypothetical protein